MTKDTLAIRVISIFLVFSLLIGTAAVLILITFNTFSGPHDLPSFFSDLSVNRIAEALPSPPPESWQPPPSFESNDFLAPASPSLVGQGTPLSATKIYEENVECVVCINTEGSVGTIFGQSIPSGASGSGFVISSDGYIATNYHVIEGASKITVIFYDDREYSAKVIASDKLSDVALLKIEETNLKPVKIGVSSNLKVGEDVCIIGNPLGELTFSLTKGVISAYEREVEVEGNPITMFQLDAAVNPGNSGGPVFNCYGEVVGIVTAKYMMTEVEGIGFAIPIDVASKNLMSLRDYGEVRGRAYIGITISNAGGSAGGALVNSVVDGSPAQKAGMVQGDVIVWLGDYQVRSTTELLSAKNKYSPGDTVEIGITRSGKSVTLTLTFSEESSY